MKNITITTAFFDLNAKEDRPVTKRLENYIPNFEFIFSLKINMVVYVDPNLCELFKAGREKYGNINNTKIIERSYDDLYWSKYENTLQECMKINPIKNTDSKKDTVKYMVINWSKYLLVKDTIQNNYFDSDYFFWIDAGIKHVAKIPENPEDLFQNIPDEIRMLEMKTVNPNEILNLKNFCMYRKGNMAGGLWSGSKENVLEFIELNHNLTLELMEMKLTAMDEMIYSILSAKHPLLFNNFYGDYCSIVENYSGIKFLNNCIVNNMVIYSDINKEKLNIIISNMVENYRTNNAKSFDYFVKLFTEEKRIKSISKENINKLIDYFYNLMDDNEDKALLKYINRIKHFN